MVYKRVLSFLFVLTISESASFSIEHLILFGNAARIEEFPFFAATEVCGASILSERWLLTAAHCVDNMQSIASKLVFVGGERVDNSIRLKYDQIIIHPKYTPNSQRTSISYDIAVLRLQTPLTFSSKVKPVRLPGPGSSSQQLVFIGRGQDETRAPSTFLKKVDVLKLSAQECLKAAGRNYQQFFSDQSLICARRVDSRPGLCFGDSGSPLLQNGVVVGLASFLLGRDCHKTNLGFYTNVAPFVPWIKSVTGLK